MSEQKVPTDKDREKEIAEEFYVLAEALSESALEETDLELEAVEEYSYRIRAKFYTDKTLFLSRFSRGYRVLLDWLELRKPEDTSK